MAVYVRFLITKLKLLFCLQETELSGDICNTPYNQISVELTKKKK